MWKGVVPPDTWLSKVMQDFWAPPVKLRKVLDSLQQGAYAQIFL
jgi:hypothetical protein